MNEKRVWLYYRAADDGNSAAVLRAQKRRLEACAREHNFEIVGCSEDVGNAGRSECSGLLEFEAAMKRQEVDILLLDKLSCLGHASGEAVRYWSFLREHNVRLYTVAEEEIYLDMRTLFLELFGNNKSELDSPPL